MALPRRQARPTLSSNQMQRRMTAIGVPARPGRNSVLMELAAELPAVVLSQFLGISPSTVTRWSGYAWAPAAEYAGEIARRTDTMTRTTTSTDPRRAGTASE